MRTPRQALVLVRHGETEWSATGRHTSMTTFRSPKRAAGLPRRLAGFAFALVLVSPRELSYERERPAIWVWNDTSHLA